MWSRIRSLDERLIECASLGRTPILDRLLVRVTRAASYSRLWLLVAALLLIYGQPRERKAALRGLAAIAIAAALANGPAKLLARRRRPSSAVLPLIRMPRSTSFPSGHSAAAFAFATAVCAECPRLAPALFPLAGAVAYSRVHTGVHYPSDVGGGIVIGIGSGLLAARCVSQPPSDDGGRGSGTPAGHAGLGL